MPRTTHLTPSCRALSNEEPGMMGWGSEASLPAEDLELSRNHEAGHPQVSGLACVQSQHLRGSWVEGPWPRNFVDMSHEAKVITEEEHENIHSGVPASFQELQGLPPTTTTTGDRPSVSPSGRMKAGRKTEKRISRKEMAQPSTRAPSGPGLPLPPTPSNFSPSVRGKKMEM